MWIHQVGIMDNLTEKPALTMKAKDCVLMDKSHNHFNHIMIIMILRKIAVVAEKTQVKDLLFDLVAQIILINQLSIKGLILTAKNTTPLC